MKPRDLLAFFSMLLAMCCYAQTSPNTNTERPITSEPLFSITVDPLPNPVHVGSAINVTITLTNISGKDIYLSFDRGRNSAYKAFKVVLTKDNRESETTLLDRKLTDRLRSDDPVDFNDLSGSSILLPYPPGKALVTTLDLARLYDIKDPGLYRLDVSRFDEYSKATVHSNPVTLNIVR